MRKLLIGFRCYCTILSYFSGKHQPRINELKLLLNKKSRSSGIFLTNKRIGKGGSSLNIEGCNDILFEIYIVYLFGIEELFHGIRGFTCGNKNLVIEKLKINKA